MYKKILTTIALAASFLACNKVENEIVTPASEGKALEVNVTIGAPATKLAYTEATDGSYKATFDNNDVLWLYFISQADTVVGNVCKMPIDGKSISFDGKTAAFRCPSVTIPEGAVKVVTYLANTSCATNYDGGNAIIADYSAQASSTVALNNQIVTGSASVADLKSKDAATYTTSIALGYKTSLLKFSLALPEGVTVESGAALTLNMIGEKIHNKLHLVAGELGAKSDFGGISATASCADGKTVTATAAVWAADDLSSILSVVVGEETYSVEFKPSASVAAGKVYTIERTLAMAPKPTSVWTNDEAGSADFKYSGGEDLTNDWLSCKSGKVSWSANTTGAPRSAKLTFKNGATFELTQVVPADFKGSWSFTSKTFAGTGALVAKADSKTLDVTFADPRNTEALKDVDGTTTRTNNIGIKGLYGETVLDACVDIDYTAMTARVGLFLDTRDGIGQEVSGKYATYFPGLATRTDVAWAKPWIYSETELGDPDYVWMWFTVSEDFKTVMYENRTNDNCELQALTQYKNTTMNQICGFGVVLSGSNVFNNTTVTGYANFFQLNPAGSKGEFFARK